MAPSRRNSNGRSPLVNQQSQITSFFTKTPSPLPSKSNHKNPIPIPCPNPNPTCTSSPSPPTPSPAIPKSHQRKPLLLIGASPSPSSSLYSQDVVGKRIKVYWPLDKAWYEGTVKSFDHSTSKHLVQYDDDEEEVLDLAKEKVEWPQDEGSSASGRKLKRLRRGVVPAVRKMVIDDEEVEEDSKDDCNDDDDSGDEEWGKNAAVKDAEVDEDVELEEEEEEEEDKAAMKSKKKSSGKVDPRKRKPDGTVKVVPAKKSKTIAESGSGKGGFKFSVMEPTSISESM